MGSGDDPLAGADIKRIGVENHHLGAGLRHHRGQIGNVNNLEAVITFDLGQQIADAQRLGRSAQSKGRDTPSAGRRSPSTAS